MTKAKGDLAILGLMEVDDPVGPQGLVCGEPDDREITLLNSIASSRKTLGQIDASSNRSVFSGFAIRTLWLPRVQC